MSNKKNELNSLIDENYVPASTERKRAVVMYFLVGIFFGLNSEKLGKYGTFHFKQAIGWWLIFVGSLVVSVFLIFIPFLRALPILIFLFLLVMFIIFIKQANEGFYTTSSNKTIFPIFYGIGSWVSDLFEDIDSSDKEL
ncbi:hypothetical protein [Candidatus Vampirococcus lugosii]|uniref:Uncharacterized protein n=1 Tax=Candidatus Vampirococcus lugosii TaxID=2789015 RepID=A0ABS5QL57_9BACT|nr:hypothetical protein [Candidatus Vampirococcus lugosii]MBS8121797.1 hypothetical protein [Candidatus Vampirococcus lugosii]